MKTQETELLEEAAALVRAGTRDSAALLDLDHIPHVDDPFFFRVLQTKILEAVNPDNVKVFYLSHHRLCFIAPRNDIAEIEQKMAHLSAMLMEHGKSAIEIETYDLSDGDGPFLARCKRLVQEVLEADGEDGDAGISDEDNLARYLQIEESLHSADLSSLVREQPIYDFTDEQEPAVVAYELSSAIKDLEQMFGTSIRRNPWLFDRVTELLDSRMLFHLMRDRANSERIMTINVHLKTLLSSNFKNFTQHASFDWQQRVIFEIPHIEMIGDPILFHNVVERLSTYRAKLAIDGVPWSSLKEIKDDQSIIRFIKIPWDDALTGLDDEQTTQLWDDVERLGRNRCILYHCSDLDAVKTALELGFRCLQGWGVDADIAQLRMEYVDRLILRSRQAKELEDQLEKEEEEASSFLGGTWLGKLFGGRKRKPSEDEW